METNNVQAIKKILKSTSVDNAALIDIFNVYCDKSNYPHFIYDMGRFEEITKGKSIIEIIGSLDKDFSINHDYFYIDGYAHYTSGNDPEGIITTIEDLETICENIADNWWYYAKNINSSLKNSILTGVCELFIEYAQTMSKIPLEWLEINADEDRTIEENWGDYLDKLIEEYNFKE